jgi:hypothetical protein
MLAVGAFLVYKLKSPLSNFVFYSFVFYRFLVSKNIVFWAAFIFIILNNPWGLFYYKPYEWYFNLTPTVGFSYVSMFGIVLTIKAILYFKNREFVLYDRLKSYYKPIGYFIMFLLTWSLVFGHNIVSIFNISQYLPAFLLFYSVPRLLNKYELLNFNKVIFLFSLLHFSGSVVEIFSPGNFMATLFFGTHPTGIAYSNDLIRFVGGITIHLYTIFIGFYYLSIKENNFKNWYLWLVIILSYIFIINSATRGWMIASSFMFIGYFIYYVLRKKQSFKTFSIVLFILLILVTIIPDSFKSNINAAFDRLKTLEAIAGGDYTAEGTTSRLTERGPRVLSKFSESPIFGFGYSKVSAKYFDGHVGNHSLLLMGGIIGLAIIWITIFSLVWYFFRIDLRFPGNGFFVFGLALLTIMIIHSTSRSMVSYYMSADAAFLIGLIFNHFNVIMPLYHEKRTGNGLEV